MVKPSINIRVFQNDDLMAEYVWQEIKSSNYSDIIIPGGSSIQSLYRQLNTSDLDRFTFYLCDERMDGIDSIYSNQFQVQNNYGNLSTKLLGFNSSNFPEKIANLSQTKYLSILGVGADGHFASLFPIDPEFSKPGLIRNFQKPDEAFLRASMGYELLVNSDRIYLWVHGSNKAIILKYLDEMDLSIPVCRLVSDRSHLNLDTVLICDFKLLHK